MINEIITKKLSKWQRKENEKSILTEKQHSPFPVWLTPLIVRMFISQRHKVIWIGIYWK